MTGSRSQSTFFGDDRRIYDLLSAGFALLLLLSGIQVEFPRHTRRAERAKTVAQKKVSPMSIAAAMYEIIDTIVHLPSVQDLLVLTRREMNNNLIDL